MPAAVVAATLNVREARRYASRISDRWPLAAAWVLREADRCLVVLVSQGFDGIPWLERVHVAESLWDATEMGTPLEAHCYTPAELARKRSMPRVEQTLREGLDLLT